MAVEGRWRQARALVRGLGQNTVPLAGGLKQQTFIFSKFWRLEIRDPGVSRAGVS